MTIILLNNALELLRRPFIRADRNAPGIFYSTLASAGAGDATLAVACTWTALYIINDHSKAVAYLIVSLISTLT